MQAFWNEPLQPKNEFKIILDVDSKRINKARLTLTQKLKNNTNQITKSEQKNLFD